ncbi:complex I NDUFA9 subunit family protein [Emcibacter sp.]|uniref:complex I NDUFA9 subunit family protein n=1 Tax=Emcibacter sp. TaxID=1979954 RepID=UPI002AA6A909|nr:complex I NDUFA9 subunit family protein [Emcibacter sp.]
MADRLVTIFGGGGFVGSTLVQHLAKTGVRVRVAVRHPNSATHVKPLGDVGQVQVVQANLRDEKSVRAAIQGSDAVVNLVGILQESGKQKFNKIQAIGAAIVAKYAAEAGVKKLVHMSALGADADSDSHYASSKAKGEEAVKHYFPTATILRPSVIFGTDDQFFNRFAAMASTFPVMPVFFGETKFQPIYVGDVAEVIIRALNDDALAGKTLELGGPKIYSMREILELTCTETMNDIPLIDVPAPAAWVMGFFLGMLPGAPVTLDQLRLLQKDNVVSDGAEGLASLGMTGTPVEAVIPSYLVHWRPKGQFADQIEG